MVTIVFEGHELPDDGDLVPLLRSVSTRGVVERGDVGDFSPFDWVARLYEADPGWRDAVDDAYVTLLIAEDPLPRLVLDQLMRLTARSFLPRLYSAIEGRCAELSARVDTTRTDGRTLLGSMVEVAGLMPRMAHPSVALAHELAALRRPEDGWPISFRIALPGDVLGLLPRLDGVLTQLDDEQLVGFVRGMLGDGPPSTDVVFEAIGRGPTATRDRVVTAARRVTDQMKQSAGELAKLAFDDPDLQARVRAAAARPNPWPELAVRLGVGVET